MKTIFEILKSDIRSIVKNPFVLLIIAGVCLLSALYAWINIYANSDPYENTGNLPIAVASRDYGIDHKGKHVNSADEAMADLKGNKKVGWRFPGDAEKAIEGVRAGKYYAAVIFEDGFTYDMYHFSRAVAKDDHPVTYYTNTKKNAVAAKITDTVAENLIDSINTGYLKTVFEDFFKSSSKLSDKLKDNDKVGKILSQLEETRDALSDYDKSISLFTAGSGNIKNSLNSSASGLKNAKSRSSSKIASAKSAYKQAKKTIRQIKKTIDKKKKKLKKSINTLKEEADKIKSLSDKSEIKKYVKKLSELTEEVLTILEDLRSMLPDDPDGAGAKAVAETLDLMIKETKAIEKILKATDFQPKAAASIAEHASDLARMMDSELTSAFSLMISDIDTAVKQMEPLLTSAGKIVDDTGSVLSSAGNTLSNLDTSLVQLQKALQSLEIKLDGIISKVEKTKDPNEKKELLIRFLGGDPDKYSKFFSDLVTTEMEKIYPVKKYGDAMSPFYSILAIWVGGVMLVSLLRTNITRRKFPQATECQAFFGRYLIFFLLGQIQAAIIVAGDILLFKVMPVHPGLMFFAAAVASLVFTMLIFSLVLAFGDAGKAAVVVIMVLQISGSSGSYPIEILPPIFDKIYTFFPFPYAINAMREALCGMYGTDFWIYLAQLMIFFVVGIVIGLFIRRPFIGVHDFMNEKLEETEVL